MATEWIQKTVKGEMPYHKDNTVIINMLIKCFKSIESVEIIR